VTRRIRSASSALVLALLVPALAPAQERPAEERTVSFVEALRLAIRLPPAVRSALSRVATANAQIEQARAGWLPTIGVSSSPSISFSDRPFLPATNTTPAQRVQGSSVNVDASASVRWNLFDFGRTAASVHSAERSRDALREDARTAALQALSSTATQYLTVLADLEAIETTRVTVTQREARLRIAQGRVEVGATGPNDAVRAQVDLDSARLDLAIAEARVASDRAALTAALGLDPAAPVQVTRIPDELLSIDDDPSAAAAEAIRARPEFAAARFRVAQAEAQRDLAHANRRPALTANANGSIGYNEVLAGRGLGGISENVSGGVSLSWQLFDASLAAAAEVADTSVVTARENLLAQSLSVRTAAVQAAVSSRSARAQVEQAEHLAVGTAANLDLATGRYQGGAAPLLEVVDAQAADASARIAVVRARLNLALSRAQLLAATGRLERLVD
jgi:outer membrane protein TolC